MSNEDIQNKVDVAMVKATYEQKIKQLKADHKKQIKDLQQLHRTEIMVEKNNTEYYKRKVEDIMESFRPFFRMASDLGMIDSSNDSRDD
jgi:hypothetical protein